MLDILILHAMNDSLLAGTLAADLEAQGFSVWRDRGLIKRENSPDQMAGRLRTARAVIVIWTQGSAASERVRREATMAHDLGKLVSVRVPELAQADLPQGFRQAITLLLTDREKIFRVLRDMEARGSQDVRALLRGAPAAAAAPASAPAPVLPFEPARAPASAARPSLEGILSQAPKEPTGAPAAYEAASEDVSVSTITPPASPPAPQRLRKPVAAKEEARGAADSAPVQAGKLVENVPRVMRTGVEFEVEVRLSREDGEALTAGVQGEVHKHAILTTPAMTVTLQAADGCFSIQAMSRETQWIDGSQHATLGLTGQPEFGRWKWIVRPIKSGKHRLNIVAAAKTTAGGVQAETQLPEQIVQVEVRVNYVQAAREVAKWLAVAAAGGIVSEYATTVFKLAIR